METAKNARDPQLRTHKRSGRQYATFNGRTVWFGHKSDRQTKTAFDAYKARWVLNGYRDPDGHEKEARDLTVRELVERYDEHLHRLRPADWFERNGDRQTRAMQPLVDLFGDEPAARFGPKALQTVRQAMLAGGRLCRSEINARIGIIKAAFVRAGSDELIPPSVAHGVKLLPGFKHGDYGVREGIGHRSPVDAAVVEATVRHLHATVAAVVRLLHVTGARPSEVCNLTPAMIDRSGDVWTAELADHKTRRHELDRELVFGPRAQRILLPFLDHVPQPNPHRPIFNPATALTVEDRAGRKTRQPGDRYCATSLRKAIDRGIKRENRERARTLLRAFVREHGEAEARRLLRDRYRVATYSKHRLGTPPQLVDKLSNKRAADLVTFLGGEPIPSWTTYQLRHAALSRVRREHGLEAAAAIGGHSLGKENRITEGYTGEAQRALAIKVARRTG